MKTRQPNKRAPSSNTVSKDAEFWFRQFTIQLEQFYSVAASRLPKDADITELRKITIQALINTLIDSGMTINMIHESILQLKDSSSSKLIWNEQLNQRRIKLIDKEIQGSLSVQEGFELARLTKSMRDYLQVNYPLDMDGVRRLHENLLALKSVSEK